MTRQEEIDTVHAGGIHLVILGAGASLASNLRNPERNGNQLPLMNNIVEIVGLQDIVARLPKEIQTLKNQFELLFSKLFEDERFEGERIEIEKRIYEYFENLELPDEPTIYDYLILSLRHKKDVIATFNWDPFLYQAYVRNGKFTKSPGILFLHGTVALGYNHIDGTSGPAGWYSRKNNGYFDPVRLLYPVDKKDYNSDDFIHGQWESLSLELKEAKRVTVFGYSAPNTDVEAINLLQEAWGTADERNMEQFELIDIRDEKEVKESWDTFIHTHHYDYGISFFDSSIAHHPRRSVESYWHWAYPTTINEAFQEGNPVPQDFKSLEEMWEWFRPLIDAEEAYAKKQASRSHISKPRKKKKSRSKLRKARRNHVLSKEIQRRKIKIRRSRKKNSKKTK